MATVRVCSVRDVPSEEMYQPLRGFPKRSDIVLPRRSGCIGITTLFCRRRITLVARRPRREFYGVDVQTRFERSVSAGIPVIDSIGDR